MSRLVPLIAVVLLIATVGGCGGNDEAADTTTAVTSPVTETDTATTTTPDPSPAWTEFGATVANWDAAHEPDPNYPAEGCCYLPGPKSAGGRYAALFSDDFEGTIRVDGFSIFWDDKTIPVALAREVVRQAAPPQARLARTIQKHGCVMIQYRSPALTRAFYKGAVMVAALYSPGEQPFNGTVNDISFLSVPGGSVGC